MPTTYWRNDPESGEIIGPLDEEELAKKMWRTICRAKGLAVDAPYVINNDFDNMTWSEQTCDHLWRKIYRKRCLIKTPSDVELIENKKAFMEDLKKKLAEEEWSPFDISRIHKMMKKTQEDLDELMNKDNEPKMLKKPERPPLIAMRCAGSRMPMKKLAATKEDLDELMNKDEPKMMKKKKIQPEKPPLIAMRHAGSHMPTKKLTAEEGDATAAASTMF